MKLFDKIRTRIRESNWYKRGLLKYIVVTLVFLVLLLVREGGNPFSYVQNKIRIHQLQQSIEELDQSAVTTKQKIHDLQSSDEQIEKFARERYLMHQPNEDVYVVSEDTTVGE